MNRNSYVIFAGLFLGICVILCVGIWYSITELRACREEYDQLDSERHNNSGMITNLETRNAALSRITRLSINNAVLVPDAVAFFSMVRTIMERHNISLLYMTTSGQADSGKKDNVLQIKVDGGYYDMVGMFADLRGLSTPSKITRLSLKRNHDLPEELVEADITLEVLTED